MEGGKACEWASRHVTDHFPHHMWFYFCPFLGLQNRLHLPLPLCSRENQTQKWGGDSSHGHSLRVWGGRHPGARPEATCPEAAEGEDPLAQHAQHLPAGQRGRRGPEEHGQPPAKDHSKEGRGGSAGEIGVEGECPATCVGSAALKGKQQVQKMEK